ncbi:hypothetical protein FOG50_00477 [Hanseniaspora uvarum]|nr:hypothetical protein FOG50_00477 [Hanseniaspora uvarum]
MMMSDDEFDDNVEGNIGVMGDGTKTEAQSNIGEKRKHEEENSSEEDSEGFDSDASDYELDKSGESKREKRKKAKTNPVFNAFNFSRKDKSLQDILEFLDEQPPVIPNVIVDYYLKKNGMNLKDDKIKKLISLATSKFITDIAVDAYEYSRIRSGTAVYNATNGQQKARQLLMGQQQQKLLQQELNNNTDMTTMQNKGNSDANVNKANTQQQHNDKDRVVLRMSDLSSALKEYGLDIQKPNYYR